MGNNPQRRRVSSRGVGGFTQAFPPVNRTVGLEACNQRHLDWRTLLARGLQFELKPTPLYDMGKPSPTRRVELVANMMTLTKFLAVVGLAALFAAASARAQTNVTSASQPPVKGQVLVPERLTTTDSANTTKLLRPARPERAPLPPEVVARIESFKRDARAYLDKQEALKKKLQGANDQERAVIRDRLRELREQWLERSRELRKEYRERLQELADKMPEYRELLDSIRSSAQDQLRQSQSDTRTRRGND